MKTSTALRLAELRALDLLGQPMPDALNSLVRVAAQVTGASAAHINVITGTSQHTLASTAPELDTYPADESFCARIIEEPDRDHVVPDARQDPRFRNNPHTRAGAVTTYASSQLVTANNVVIGTLCVFDPAHREIDPQMMEVLSELSRAAMSILEARRHHEELEVSLSQLVDVQRELRRSNEHLSAFAGQVSHDLQGPLAGVMLALQMMEDELEEDVEFEPEHRAMFLRRALASAERMRATVAGLLDFASLGGTIRPTRLDMNLVVKDVTSDLASRMSGVRLDVADLPDMWGDEVHVRAVVQNLVSNALKYAGAVPDACICISGTQRGQRTRVTVSDNGPGVPASQREAIFELLVRGDDAADSGVQGLGIGLATCRRIVQSHGGDLGVRDSAMGGAEFWFELPPPPPD